MVDAKQPIKYMVDTNCFIYLIEGRRYPEFHAIVEPLFKKISGGNILGLTSPITLTEIMTLPKKNGREDLAYNYKSLICNFPHLSIPVIDNKVADQAASIRSTYNFKTPDAIQVAMGIVYEATAFVTFDRELKKASSLIEVIIPNEV